MQDSNTVHTRRSGTPEQWYRSVSCSPPDPQVAMPCLTTIAGICCCCCCCCPLPPLPCPAGAAPCPLPFPPSAVNTVVPLSRQPSPSDWSAQPKGEERPSPLRPLPAVRADPLASRRGHSPTRSSENLRVKGTSLDSPQAGQPSGPTHISVRCLVVAQFPVKSVPPSLPPSVALPLTCPFG